MPPYLLRPPTKAEKSMFHFIPSLTQSHFYLTFVALSRRFLRPYCTLYIIQKAICELSFVRILTGECEASRTYHVPLKMNVELSTFGFFMKYFFFFLCFQCLASLSVEEFTHIHFYRRLALVQQLLQEHLQLL